MAANPHVVNARAKQRLAAKLVDAAPLLLAGAVVLGTGPWFAAGAAASSPLAAASVTAGAAYCVWLWWWEAGSGKTPGNLALGIRTTDEAGHAPGLLGVFLRGMLLALSAVTVAGPLVVLVSNVWDANDRRQGWHDKAAHTLMVDIRAGRNPLATGGLRPTTAADAAGWIPGRADGAAP